MAPDVASPPPTVASALAEAAALLRGARDVDEPLAEARLLLLAILDERASWVVRHRDEPLGDDARGRLLAAARRRAAGMPAQYATGRAAFRHLVLDVDQRVLIPRPETEVLVDLALGLAGEGGIALDVGTGSGCIALALASEGRFERVIATDVSSDALSVARENARQLRGVLRAPVELRHGSLLAPVADVRARIVASNPPYIALGEAPGLPPSVRDWEPPLALYSGGDGMTHVAELIEAAPAVLEPGGWLLMEVDSRRAGRAAALAAADGRYAAVEVRPDLTGRERFVVARRRATDVMPNDRAPGRASRGTR